VSIAAELTNWDISGYFVEDRYRVSDIILRCLSCIVVLEAQVQIYVKGVLVPDC